VKKTTWVLIGHVPVDSGQVVILDPCRIEPGMVNNSEKMDFDNPKSFYEHCCKATLSKDGHGPVEMAMAVACTSGCGDGEYPVYAKLDAQGTILEMKIDFK